MDKPAILIVDDTPENLRVLGDLLEEAYEVRVATNGPDALNTIKSSPPDLILLDILMPGMNGYEVCRQLKANPDLRIIPVLFISALDEPQQKIQAFHEGAVDYITKPFQAEEVVARVRTHIQLSRLEDLKREIAERKKVEEERNRLFTLEQIARLEAEAALRDRDEFITIGAHELKTPLAILKIQIEGMQKLFERAEAPSTQSRHGLDIVARQVQRLVRLISELLDVTRIRSGRLEIHPYACDLAALTREILACNQAALQRSGCEASYSGPESIPGVWDPNRLEQVLENLLGNAMKFAPGNPIDVQCVDSPETLRISIRDRGMGIPVSDLERIFEPYERGGRELHFGGLGMGLFISRKIIREHGGSIRAENAEDGGACFTIELPRGETRCVDRVKHP